MTSAWQLWLLWGFAVGIGTGSLALVFGAIVANRWFVRHRGLVIGVFSAASSTGQLVFLPAIAAPRRRARLALGGRPGRRGRAALVPLVWWSCATTPPTSAPRRTARGTGWAPPPPEPTVRTRRRPGRDRRAAGGVAGRGRSGSSFATFWICGWSTNGLIGTHFIPAAHDHGMPATTSASLLALIGVFDIVGTVASGWLTDRVDSRYLLFGYYFFRGLSLLVVPWLLGPHVHPSLFLFILFYGLDWVATVPPTVALCRQHFGIEKSARGLRLGLRQPHGRRRRRGQLRRLDPHRARRLLRGLADRRRAVPDGGAALCLLVPRRAPFPDAEPVRAAGGARSRLTSRDVRTDPWDNGFGKSRPSLPR